MKSGMRLTEIQNIKNFEGYSSLPPLRVAILRNISIDPMVSYIEYHAYKSDLRAVVSVGEYDNILQDSIDQSREVITESTEFVLVFMKLENISIKLSRMILCISEFEIHEEIDRIKEYIRRTLTGIRDKSQAIVLWHGFETPVHSILGILGSNVETSEQGLVKRLNVVLKDELSKIPSAYFVDTDLCVARVGAIEFYDSRYWHLARAPYSRRGVDEIARNVSRVFGALRGKSKKCLVLDCDNTLWGGVLGEEGLEGIKLGLDYPGSTFLELQREILNLKNKGVFLALCSKNNEADVLDVLMHHKEILLKPSDFSTIRINWLDKVTNLKSIAVELNIGLDSLVFVDDSEFEIELVREALPEVTTLHIPPVKAVEARNILLQSGLFDTLVVTDEDKTRQTLVINEKARNREKDTHTSLESYLESLSMNLSISFATPENIPRIAQLTQKTNQFNLTTRRYSEAQIRSMSITDEFDVFGVSLSDKFGDYGLIGVCIVRYDSKVATIDTFLLSCRVLGRSVEYAVITELIELVSFRGASVLLGEYVSTNKNSQVSSFYDNVGFSKVGEQAIETVQCYRLDLCGYSYSPHPLFKVSKPRS
jgi:FkbH-like protein